VHDSTTRTTRTNASPSEANPLAPAHASRTAETPRYVEEVTP